MLPAPPQIISKCLEETGLNFLFCFVFICKILIDQKTNLGIYFMECGGLFMEIFCGIERESMWYIKLQKISLKDKYIFLSTWYFRNVEVFNGQEMGWCKYWSYFSKKGHVILNVFSLLASTVFMWRCPDFINSISNEIKSKYRVRATVLNKLLIEITFCLILFIFIKLFFFEWIELLPLL